MVPVIPSNDTDRDNDKYQVYSEPFQNPDGSTAYKYHMVDKDDPSIQVNLIGKI